MSDDKVIRVARTGIQEVSALLPFFGHTTMRDPRCDHPLSIRGCKPQLHTGSLGLVKAGFIVLRASVDRQRRLRPSNRRHSSRRRTPSSVPQTYTPMLSIDRYLPTIPLTRNTTLVLWNYIASLRWPSPSRYREALLRPSGSTKTT
jgi:hypothetical protein